MSNCILGEISVGSPRRSAETLGLNWERVPSVLVATLTSLSDQAANLRFFKNLINLFFYFILPQFEV